MILAGTADPVVIAAGSEGVSPWVPLLFGLVGTIVGAGSVIAAELVRARVTRRQALEDQQRQWMLEAQDAVDNLAGAVVRAAFARGTDAEDDAAVELTRAHASAQMRASRVTDFRLRALALAVGSESVRFTQDAESEPETVGFVVGSLSTQFHERVHELLFAGRLDEAESGTPPDRVGADDD
jgi:hypothetical protein